MTNLLTITEVADLLRVAEGTVRRLPIVSTRVGKQIRYEEEEVLRFIRGSREFHHEKKIKMGMFSKSSRPVGASKILSWPDLQRIASDGAGRLGGDGGD